MEDKQIIEDFNQLRKKVEEILQNQNFPLIQKTAGNENYVHSPSKLHISGKFLDWNTFKDFSKSIKDEIDDLTLNTNDNKCQIEEMQLAIPKKANSVDLASLESKIN